MGPEYFRVEMKVQRDEGGGREDNAGRYHWR